MKKLIINVTAVSWLKRGDSIHVILVLSRLLDKNATKQFTETTFSFFFFFLGGMSPKLQCR